MRSVRFLLGAASVALFATSVVGLATRDDPPPPARTGPAEVSISDFAYGPELLEVAAGTTVTWTNDDSTVHTVDSASGSEIDSGTFDSGAAFEHTFESPGTYAYICDLHPFMKGVIEVTP